MLVVTPLPLVPLQLLGAVASTVLPEALRSCVPAGVPLGNSNLTGLFVPTPDRVNCSDRNIPSTAVLFAVASALPFTVTTRVGA
jgi:hypothetical protein